MHSRMAADRVTRAATGRARPWAERELKRLETPRARRTEVGDAGSASSLAEGEPRRGFAVGRCERGGPMQKTSERRGGTTGFRWRCDGPSRKTLQAMPAGWRRLQGTVTQPVSSDARRLEAFAGDRLEARIAESEPPWTDPRRVPGNALQLADIGRSLRVPANGLQPADVAAVRGSGYREAVAERRSDRRRST